MNKLYNLLLILLVASVLISCSSKNEPSSEQIFTAFNTKLPETIDFEKFEIELSENIGTKVEPVIRSRIKGTLELKEARYEEVGKLMGSVIIEEKMPKGSLVEIFAFSNSVLIQDEWNISFDKVNLKPEMDGQVRSFWGDRKTVLSGSAEEQKLLEARKQKYLDLGIDTPDGALLASIAAMKSNDLASLIKNSLSQAQYDELVTEFENNKSTSFSEADKAQFAQTIGMLTADGAEETLFAMAAPQLEQARAMLPMMLMMGKDQVIQGIKNNPMLPEAQRDSAAAVVGAAMDWAGENDILSEEKTKAAIAVMVDTAKSLNINSLDEVQNMSFDQALEKGSLVFGGVKGVLGAYGISMDDMLDSVAIDNVNVEGDKATMDVTFDVFGEEVKQVMNMVKKDGVWVGEQ